MNVWHDDDLSENWVPTITRCILVMENGVILIGSDIGNGLTFSCVHIYGSLVGLYH